MSKKLAPPSPPAQMAGGEPRATWDTAEVSTRPKRASGRYWLRVACVVATVALSFAYGASILNLPHPRPSDAPSTVFSAGRAMGHVQVIGSEPHPAGSPAMAKVAAYLQSQLSQVGLEVEPLVMRDPTTGVTLRVVVGRLPGRASTGAVAFIAHPDSVAAGPGAGDNATGAATLLETARALATHPPRNDVLFVFDDGEEIGDYPGGHLFADNHPWAKEVKMAVGIDTAAWGVPSLMQDSDDNGRLIRGYARGVDHPVAFGLDASTNRQDQAEIEVFRSRGIPAIELEDTYANVNQHTAGDTVDRVNRSSLQAMGDQVLGVARVYGDMDLNHAKAPDRVFFPVPGVGLVHYPAAWGGLLLVALVALTAMVFMATRRLRLPLTRIALGVAAACGVLLVVGVLAKIAAVLYAHWYPDPRLDPLPEYLLGSSAPYAIASLVAIALAAAALYWLAARWIGDLAVGLGFVGVWVALSALAVAAAPVGAYTFEWPALLAAAAWLWLLRDARRSGIALLIPAAVAVFFLAPVLLLAYFAGGVAEIPALGVTGALAIGFIGPAVSGITRDT